MTCALFLIVYLFLVDQEYSLASLAIASEEAVSSLIPKAGPRALFLRKWTAWKTTVVSTKCLHFVALFKWDFCQCFIMPFQEKDCDESPSKRPRLDVDDTLSVVSNLNDFEDVCEPGPSAAAAAAVDLDLLDMPPINVSI